MSSVLPPLCNVKAAYNEMPVTEKGKSAMGIEPESILMAVRTALREAEQALQAGDFDLAKAKTQYAIDVAYNQNHSPSLASAYYGMAAVIWGSGGDSATAHHFASLAAQNSKANTRTDLLVRTLVARLKAARGNYEAAIVLNEDLLRFYFENDLLEGQANILRSLGDVYRAKGEFNKAEDRYLAAREAFERLQTPEYLFDFVGLLVSLGSLKLQQNQPEAARRFWEEAQSIAEAQGYRHILSQIQQGMELLDEQ
jgi:tetratricopeptide (TPR) repeat protein